MKLFAVCAPGLEPFLAQELDHLGLGGRPEFNSSLSCQIDKRFGEEMGGVEFDGSFEDMYRANLHLRTASRILLRLKEFYAVGFAELRRKAGNLCWEEYLAPGQPVAIRVASHQSRLYHQKAVAERIAGAISDRLKHPVDVHRYREDGRAESSQLVAVRLMRDGCTISIDSSGELLHRRGYRLATAKAPLRETLAAAMVHASGWDTASPLVDPFCGSGTIPIEAALMAKGIAPGRNRRFAFMDWPHFEEKTWQKLLASGQQPRAIALPRIIASDRDAGAIEAAKSNAKRAGVEGDIEFTRQAFSSIEPPPGPGWVVTNPPYGIRIKSIRDLRNLYAQFGKTLRLKFVGWRITLLSSHLQLLRSTGIALDRGISLKNGGIRVKLVRGLIG